MAWTSEKCPHCRTVNQYDDRENEHKIICSNCGDTIYLNQEENLENVSFFGKYFFSFLSVLCISLGLYFGENVFVGTVVFVLLFLLLSKYEGEDIPEETNWTNETTSTTSTTSATSISSPRRTDSSSRSDATNWAIDMLNNSENCLILDTETTGLRETDEVIEIGIIDMNGKTIFHSYVKPLRRRSIPVAAARIHGITMAKLKDSPTMIDIHPQIRNLLKGRIVIAYNSNFDKRLLKQTFNKYDLTSLTKVVWQDAMVPYSNFVGSSRWVKLPGATHGTLGDCKAVLKIINEMAQNNP